jgi:hypothetical protein
VFISSSEIFGHRWFFGSCDTSLPLKHFWLARIHVTLYCEIPLAFWGSVPLYSGRLCSSTSTLRNIRYENGWQAASGSFVLRGHFAAAIGATSTLQYEIQPLILSVGLRIGRSDIFIIPRMKGRKIIWLITILLTILWIKTA